MTRMFKAVGLIFAVFALTAVSASQAVAAESLLTPAKSPAFIEGTQSALEKLVLTGKEAPNAVTIKCETSTLTPATVQNTTVGGVTGVREATTIPHYNVCTLAGLVAEVTTHQCVYTITNTTTALTAKADLEGEKCNIGEEPIEIEVPATGCTVTIGHQKTTANQNLSAITFANVATVPTTVTATLNLTGISYTGDSKCPANIVGSFTNGDLTGGYTLKAYEDVEGKKGAQIGLKAD